MERSIQEEIEFLTSLARDKGVRAEQIAHGDRVVSPWVRFKCRYGCKNLKFGKILHSCINPVGLVLIE